MRRVLGTILVAALLGGAWFALSGSDGGGSSNPKYWVELDNAFGLVKGGDLKVAGVRAGRITAMELDTKTRRARIGIEITQNGFGSLRRDVQCAARPQSLIGEFFLDCLPGTDRVALKSGAVIPVDQTSSNIAPDLVNDILRRPEKERLAIILQELGAAVAGNGANLNSAVRRASPALAQTDKLLALLASQNHVLADLATNADTVLKDLSDNRRDVGRWVVNAGNAADATAMRHQALEAGLKRFPGFLRGLRSNMVQLGAVADAQTPALRNLDASAKQLTEFFDRLGPFSDASRPAVRALGTLAKTGTRAVRTATPTVRQLRAFSGGTPELGANLAIVLEHLDDPAHAVENDPRAAAQTGRPAPTGYSGLEALLQYVLDQTTSTNLFDGNSHLLNISAFAGGDCADYADRARARKFGKECGAALGPNQPGLNSPDPTDPETGGALPRRKTRRAAGSDTAPAAAGGGGSGSAPATDSGSTPAPGGPAGDGGALKLPGLGDVLPGGSLPIPGVGNVPLPGGAARPPDKQTQSQLLDFLLGS